MVQIIPNRSSPSKGEKFSKAIGEGLDKLSKYRSQQDLSQAFKDIEDIYGDENLTDQQKIIKSYKALSSFPEQQKALSEQLYQSRETPLQKAQRLKMEQEINSLNTEEDFFNRLTSGNKNENPSEMQDKDIYGIPLEETPYRTSKSKKSEDKFDYNDPSTWTDKQINQFRSIEGKSAKAKTLAKTAQNEYEQRNQQKLEKKKYQETIAPFEGALSTLNQMEKIGKRGNLGIGTSIRGLGSSATRKDASEYERLGKSLISFASNIPIRNRQEFETLAHDLYDPSISDASREGILSAMKRIIENAMKSTIAPEEENAQINQVSASKERPPLTSFLR